ncbi:MAG: GMC family oxidoreductase [Acidimicrobiia bacterium]|nr:GMC family oxidoreductase [Acidimicrobiia bacterium]
MSHPPIQPDDLRHIMRRHTGTVDALIVGSGAGGAVLAKELAEGGMTVVVLEAGDWHDTRHDYVNDELSMLGRLDWDDPRITDGDDPLRLGRVNTGRAVGGTTVHYTAMTLRLDPSDFQIASTDGVGVDWPFGYDELAGYYSEVERFLPVSGPRSSAWVSGAPYPHGELPWSAKDHLIGKGLDSVGYRTEMTPHAIATSPVDGRSACMYYGFCANGCKSDARGSANVNYIPRAVAAGAEIRPGCFATTIESTGGRVTGVTYLEDGEERFQGADRVFVCCYAIETPRLLLNSGNLANSSDQVGRNLMVHSGPIAYGRFDQPIDSFVTPPVGIMTRDPYGTPARPGLRTGMAVEHLRADADQLRHLARVLQPGPLGRGPHGRAGRIQPLGAARQPRRGAAEPRQPGDHRIRHRRERRARRQGDVLLRRQRPRPHRGGEAARHPGHGRGGRKPEAVQ